MTKNKLLELYNKLKQEEICVSIIRQLKNCSDQEIDIIMSSKYPLVMIAIMTNYEFKLLSNDKKEEIINMINKAKNEEFATGIFYIVRSGIILSSGLTTEIAKIIIESNTKAVSYVIDTALNINVLINQSVLELLTIIGSSKKGYQAAMAANVAKSIDVLLSGNVIELTKIASQTEGEEQSVLVGSIAKNRDVLSSGIAVKLTKLVSLVNTESTELIKTLAYNKILEKNKRSVYYLVKMLEAKTYEEVCNIYNEALLEIEFLKQQESKAKKDNGLFWNVYKNNSSEAIELLKNSDKTEITLHTRIRKKTNV